MITFMPRPVPLPPDLIHAACILHGTLTPWHRSDDALQALKDGVPDFSAAATLAKAATVNALYYTNVFAIVRVAEHFSNVLTQTDLASAGPELVDELANVPRGGKEERAVRRVSLAAKFAHFFLDEDRFPIYDKYAVRMVAKHTGASMSSLGSKYAVFAKAFDELATTSGIVTNRRRLDRYLWIQGQYEEWITKGTASSGDLEAAFKRGAWPPRD